MLRHTIALLGLCVALANATTWYVRLDGGTRYSAANPNGGCNGMYDAPYPGSGVNQNCAFSDIRHLWSDYSYCSNPGVDCWTWVGQGGDTYIVDQNPNGWRIGWSNAEGQGVDDIGWIGLPGDPYGSGAPPPHSGTETYPTYVLGRNWENCYADYQKTQVFGDNVFNFAGTTNVYFSCFDISDHSPCGTYASPYGSSYPVNCDRGGIYDFADNGIRTDPSTTNLQVYYTVVHGMGSYGWLGPVGDNIQVNNIKIKGNSAGGFNFDDGSGATGSGTMSISSFQIFGSGCCEMYPVDPSYRYPYQYCVDQNAGGYGDAFGTATVQSNPAWVIWLDGGEIAYNTQDGIDGLHVSGLDSSGVPSQLIMTNLLSYSNMGDQIKIGSAGSLQASIIYDNPPAMGQANPDFPPGYNTHLTQFGRGLAGVVGYFSPGRPLVIQGNTIFSSSTESIALYVDQSQGTINQDNSGFVFRNNIQLGFVRDVETGWSDGDGRIANSLYLDDPLINDIAAYPSSSIGDNAVFGDRNDVCPRTSIGETAANTICVSPGLWDESYHLYGYGNVGVSSYSAPIVYFGTWEQSDGFDFLFNDRHNPGVTIGALEFGSNLQNLPPASPTAAPPTAAPGSTAPPTPATGSSITGFNPSNGGFSDGSPPIFNPPSSGF